MRKEGEVARGREGGTEEREKGGKSVEGGRERRGESRLNERERKERVIDKERLGSGSGATRG